VTDVPSTPSTEPSTMLPRDHPPASPSTDASADHPPAGRSDASAGSPAGESKLDEIIAGRRAKVAALRDAGIEPYPVRFRPTAHARGGPRRLPDLEPGAETGDEVTVAGRLVAKREMGKLRFLVLREDGVDLQLFCPVKALDEASRELIGPPRRRRLGRRHRRGHGLQEGRAVGQAGDAHAARQGLRPLPDKWHGLTDTEARFRQREVDLVVNPEARRVFEVRSAVLKALRAEMDERGFVEVETPMLHPIPGGATAKPFVTHHNTLDTDLYLRIAPELYLKRLIAGGMRRVYEINRNFRNEGMSTRHNPEFTMLESYAAYDDYHDVMELTEALLQRAATEAVGTLELSYQGRAVSLAGPFRRASLLSLTREASGTPS
jgi:lysyl-tRNA synthetase, class II